MATALENHSGIPRAPFHEDVNRLIEPGQTPETTVQAFRQLSTKYELMMENLAAREGRLKEKIKEIEASISGILNVTSGKESDDQILQYELGETLFAKAKVSPTTKVHLWLGANVLLEYEVEEALALLRKKLKDNQDALERVKQDARFAREQLTTMEVNTARLINMVIERRKSTTGTAATN